MFAHVKPGDIIVVRVPSSQRLMSRPVLQLYSQMGAPVQRVPISGGSLALVLQRDNQMRCCVLVDNMIGTLLSLDVERVEDTSEPDKQ